MDSSSSLPFRRLTTNDPNQQRMVSEHGQSIRSPSQRQRPSTSSSLSSVNSNRVSLLDALNNLSFGRRRKSLRQTSIHHPHSTRPVPIILPDVIEITAQPKDSDAEVEERGRLREQAAQALGIALSNDNDGPDLGSDTLQDPISDQDDSRSISMSMSRHSESISIDSPKSFHYPLPQTQPPATPFHSSTTSIPMASTPGTRTASYLGHGRSRSGSMPAVLSSPKSSTTTHTTLTHTRSSSLNPPSHSPIPPFPSTPASLTPYTQLSGSVPKHYPSSSLRIFALSKQWKTRYIVLSSPPVALPFSPIIPSTTTTQSVLPPSVSVSYLHLFKSNTHDEKELERLEINEDSIVFVADEDDHGPKQGKGKKRATIVIKVGGLDVGAMKKDLNHEEGGRTMWLLQMQDSKEAQMWIGSIKNMILNQRTVRAGLSPGNAGSGIEPRGDMDVMLSMRAQGIIPSSPTSVSSPPDSPSHRSNTHRRNTDSTAGVSSIRSSQSHLNVTGSTFHSGGGGINGGGGSGPVSALRGLFTGSGVGVGNRPRSSSRAASIVSSESGVGASGSGGIEEHLNKRESVVSTLSRTDVGGNGSGHSTNYSSNTYPKGNSLMTLLRTNTLEHNKHQHQHTASASLPIPIVSSAGSPKFNSDVFFPPSQESQPKRHQLDRKIIEDPNAYASAFGDRGDGDDDDEDVSTPVFRSPLNVFEGANDVHDRAQRQRALSVDGSGSISLQPPPRKRWTTMTVSSLASASSTLEEEEEGESHAKDQDQDEEPESPLSTSFSNSQLHLQSDNLSIHERPERPGSASTVSLSPGGASIKSINWNTNGNGNGHGQGNGSAFGSPEQRDQRPRSTSTGSGSMSTGSGADRASINTKRSSSITSPKRWSRQLPQRLTPPSGPVPAIPLNGNGNGNGKRHSMGSPTKAHPYAMAERSPSRSSRSSLSNTRPSFAGKRASTSSAFSVSTSGSRASGVFMSLSNAQTNSSSHTVGGVSHTRPGSSHRASLAPPPRPAPTAALPPAPIVDTEETSHQTHSAPPTAAPHKHSFRDSVSNRAFRLSLNAPKPPPSSTLPPRPDEEIQHIQAHLRRWSTNNSMTLPSTKTHLYSIPGSPVPISTLPKVVPLPPPADPLPPTPISPTSRFSGLGPSITPSRASSIKQRLRIRSAPTPSPPASLNNLPVTRIVQPTTSITPSGTPQSEKSAFILNNDFSSLASPVSPSFPTPKVHSPPPLEPEPELTSLSPPPRRGSKRMSIAESQEMTPAPIPEESSSSTPEEPQPILSSSLTRSGSASVISLGIVSM